MPLVEKKFYYEFLRYFSIVWPPSQFGGGWLGGSSTNLAIGIVIFAKVGDILAVVVVCKGLSALPFG